MITIFLISIFIPIILIILSIILYIKIRESSDTVLKAPLNKNFQFLNMNIKAHVNTKNIDYFSQSPYWRNQMFELGKHIKNSNVKHIVFVHGTYAGNDPFEIFTLFTGVFPIYGPILAKLSKRLMKFSTNKLLNDRANFSPAYIKLAGNALSNNLKVHDFRWSSGNNHLARLKGAIDLIKLLSKLKTNSFEKVLLIGHSHAGQLFCILEHLLQNSNKGIKLKQFMKNSNQFDLEYFEDSINKLSNEHHYITMGAPSRYQWPSNHRYKILHLINHRGLYPYGGSFLGLFFTTGGDYIQQMGIAGSDVPPIFKNDRNLNDSLNKILDNGNNLVLWNNNIFKKQRLSNWGQTLLIDYKDNGLFPNIYKTFFGHGVYTRYEMMLFNFETIVKYLYHPN
mgnify:CR=1 FL=1